jgi:4-methylaminobutanoate oxidase (formaldehyde-forming)
VRDKPFLGAQALAGREVERRLRCLLLEDPRSVALGNEPVRIGGEVRGRVTSGGYGYTVGRSIAYAYLPAEVDVGTEVEVDIFGRWVAGQVAGEPLYDPDGQRVRSLQTA